MLNKIINLENSTEKEFSEYKIRNTVRAIIFDNENKIGIMHVTKGGFYKLSGGGIESGETKEQALKRECLEEAGVDIEITSELGLIVEVKKMHKLVQNSYCYTAKVAGKKGNQKLTEKENEEGFEIEWMSLDNAIKKIIEEGFNFKHGQYVFEREKTILEEAKSKL